MFSIYIFTVLLILIIGFFILTKTGKRLRIRASGTAEEIVQKDASTPEGAKAYYNAAIAKKEEEYRNSHTVYAQMLGKIQSYEDQLRSLQKENIQLNLNINNCIDKNDDVAAKVYLNKQAEVKDKIEIIKDELNNLKENSKLQKEVVDNTLEELNRLKSEKEKSILELEAAQTRKNLKVTSLSSSAEEDTMLEKVREGIKKVKEEADGNKIAYENSTDVQQKRLDKKMKDDEIQRQLDKLKSERKK